MAGTSLAPFAEVISALQSGQYISKQSVLRKLNPFLNDQGILRVGGRLGYSVLAFSAKDPPILLKQSPISSLYVELTYTISFHGGPKLTLSILLPVGEDFVEDYSDNSTTFKRVNKELPFTFGAASTFYAEVATILVNDGVEWPKITYPQIHPTSEVYGRLTSSQKKITLSDY